MNGLRPSIIFSIATLALSVIGHCRQTIVQAEYNEERASKALNKEFFKGFFWQMPTDTAGVCYFVNKKDARRTARIRVVPVYKATQLEEKSVLQPDYRVYVGLLFKQDSFLTMFHVWTNQSSKKYKQEIALVEDPPSGFLSYSYKNRAGYILDENKFVVFENGNSKTWNCKTHHYEAFQPIASENTTLLTNSAESQKIPDQTIRTIEYLLKKNSSYKNWLLKCISNSDTVTISTAEQIPNTELFRNKIVYKRKHFSLEYGGFRFIFDNNRNVLGTYIPNDVGIIGEKQNQLEFKIIQSNRSNSFKFIDSTNDEILLSAQYMRRSYDDYLVVQLKTDRQSELLDLIAVLVFSEMWIKK